jgi:hypothetical protein
MKRLIFLVLLFSSINCYSQTDSVNVQINYHTPKNYHSAKKLNNLKLIGIYTASILLNGIGDGLNDNNHKTVGHLLNGLSIGALISSPFLLDYDKKKWYWYLATYTSLRIGLFDIAYNSTRGLPFGYSGMTSPTDKFYNSMHLNPTIPRSVFFALGISIPITEL